MENGTRREAEQKNFKVDCGSERNCLWVHYVCCISTTETRSVEVENRDGRRDGVGSRYSSESIDVK